MNSLVFSNGNTNFNLRRYYNILIKFRVKSKLYGV